MKLQHATRPLAVTGWAAMAATLADAIDGLLHLGSLVAALACVVLRFRASGGVQRQQLRWVAAGAATAVVGLLAVTALLGGAVLGLPSQGYAVVAFLTLPCLPGAIAVAVIDRTMQPEGASPWRRPPGPRRW